MKNYKERKKKQKLTFNITYYPAFQNIRNILQELNLLLGPFVIRNIRKNFLMYLL